MKRGKGVILWQIKVAYTKSNKRRFPQPCQPREKNKQDKFDCLYCGRRRAALVHTNLVTNKSSGPPEPRKEVMRRISD